MRFCTFDGKDHESVARLSKALSDAIPESDGKLTIDIPHEIVIREIRFEMVNLPTLDLGNRIQMFIMGWTKALGMECRWM